ncbi:Aspartic proteinase 3 [Wickerhamomyces ciferrii]|uniref:Aspartic proteinase 3 n=1 Tax=Wickerhamomyces ciferrii (strain ATCC 14091 / BCRC 22168 / CBS 111 / JCM 3599 / NBRC 0793 / NRRL Y-1031 F-60-10) TaxID=1206466 RepID=K0KD48_WICCF|nr:Aspartic proteinase 3 [Wickerhamomyces ciferrii]CCH40806.1 Aspartic proteinase 3 [Wickerhamomyces ciferrii]
MKLSSLLSITGLLSFAIAKNIAGIQGLNFQISKGDSFATSHNSKKPYLIKRDGPEGTIETELINEISFYSVNLRIGDHEDEVTVLVDTGSSDLWVTGSNNPYCSTGSNSRRELGGEGQSKGRLISDLNIPNLDNIHKKPDSTNNGGTQGSQTRPSSSQATIDCSEHGTFDISGSSSFQSNNTDFYIVYADRTFARGTWGYDNVNVGGTNVSSLSFAVANQTNSTVGVLGIGLEELETTYSGTSNRGSPYRYRNLPSQLVQDQLINKRVYSLFLDSSDADSGTILFGGVDHSKYSGTLITVPMINTLQSRGFQNVIRLEITLSGVGLQNDRTERTVTTQRYPALLDSGTTLTYMPSQLVRQIASVLNADYSRSTGYYITRCYGANDGYIVYNFQGKLIHVPLQDIVLRTSTSNSQCVLGLFESGDDSLILGDSFLRSAYVVYDLDDLEISLAQANYDSGDSQFEVISDSVPSASRASDYSSTWEENDSRRTDDSNGNIFTNSDESQAVSTSAGGGNDNRSGSSSTSSRASSTSSSGIGSSSNSNTGNNRDSSASNLQNSSWLMILMIFGLTIGVISI